MAVEVPEGKAGASRPHTIISIPAADSVRAGVRRWIWMLWLAEWRDSVALESGVVQLSQTSSCLETISHREIIWDARKVEYVDEVCS